MTTFSHPPLLLCSQMKGQTLPPPIRGLSKMTGVEGEKEGDEEEENEGGADVMDLLPRTDIR